MLFLQHHQQYQQYQSHQSHWWIACRMLLLLLLPFGAASRSLLDDFVRLRCCCDNNNNNGLWHYQGNLMDPLTGESIAAVTGLELVRHVASTSNSTTLWTRKLFGYRPLSTTSSSYSDNNDNNHPKEQNWLQSYRLRPTSPKRIIPLEQAIAVYDSTITIHCPNDDDNDNDSDTTDTNDDNNNKRRWYIQIQRPQRADLWTTASVLVNRRRPGPTKRKNTRKLHHHDASTLQSLQITCFVRPSQNLPTTRDRPFVQFKPPATTTSFGAHETYLWQRQGNDPTQNNNHHQVQYTRYGEGPAWYGRFCTLQLKGRACRRPEDIDDPALWRALAAATHNDNAAASNHHDDDMQQQQQCWASWMDQQSPRALSLPNDTTTTTRWRSLWKRVQEATQFRDGSA